MRFKIITVVTLNVTVLWDVMPCSLAEFTNVFEGICCFSVQGRRVIASLLILLFHPEDGDSFFPCKCQYTSTRLHRATSQKTVIFIDVLTNSE
jgi:hypothetical protein